MDFAKQQQREHKKQLSKLKNDYKKKEALYQQKINQLELIVQRQKKKEDKLQQNYNNILEFLDFLSDNLKEDYKSESTDFQEKLNNDFIPVFEDLQKNFGKEKCDELKETLKEIHFLSQSSKNPLKKLEQENTDQNHFKKKQQVQVHVEDSSKDEFFNTVFDLKSLRASQEYHKEWYITDDQVQSNRQSEEDFLNQNFLQKPQLQIQKLKPIVFNKSFNNQQKFALSEKVNIKPLFQKHKKHFSQIKIDLKTDDELEIHEEVIDQKKLTQIKILKQQKSNEQVEDVDKSFKKINTFQQFLNSKFSEMDKNLSSFQLIYT